MKSVLYRKYIEFTKKFEKTLDDTLKYSYNKDMENVIHGGFTTMASVFDGKR